MSRICPRLVLSLFTLTFMGCGGGGGTKNPPPVAAAFTSVPVTTATG